MCVWDMHDNPSSYDDEDEIDLSDYDVVEDEEGLDSDIDDVEYSMDSLGLSWKD